MHLVGQRAGPWLLRSWLCVFLAACVNGADAANQGRWDGHGGRDTAPESGASRWTILEPNLSLGGSGLAKRGLRADTSFHLVRLAGSHTAVAQNAASPGIRHGRLLGAAATLLVANVAAYAYFHRVWWDHPRTRFHLYRGWRRTAGAYDLGPDDSLWHHVDKCGHLFSASQLSRHGAATARWVGLSPSQADWTGFGLATLLMLEIEIYDGFFEEWGFSLGDFLANEVGAALPLLQRRHPKWRRVAIKLSYHPSGDPVYGRYAVEDYAGMTFWLCVDAHPFLPHGLRQVWPDLLDVAIGYGVTAKANGAPELYLALDIDLRQVGGRSSLLRALLGALQAIHLPAPALRLTPRAVGYLLYF